MSERLVYDRGTGVISVDSEQLTLPRKERELLIYLLEHPDTHHTKEQLIDAVWGYDPLGRTSTLTVHVNRLRKKLERDSRSPEIISCVWGVGYRLNSDNVKIK